MWRKLGIWVEGLVGAAIQGAAVCLLATVLAPEAFNFNEGLGKLVKLVAGAAILGAAGYLRQRPTPFARQRRSSNERRENL